MGRSDLIPTWLRRSLEAAAAGAILAIAALFGTGLATGSQPISLQGLTGAVLLAPSVMALGVFTTAYPVGMAATRTDALFGAIAAFLIAADVTMVAAGGPILLSAANRQVPAGVLAALGALPAAIAGLIAAETANPFGFGRRAGAAAAVTAAIVGLVVLLGIGSLL